MINRKRLVLDANILIRAVLGKRVKSILNNYEREAWFGSPEFCFFEAQKQLPRILAGPAIDAGLAMLDQLTNTVEFIDETSYRRYKIEAQERMRRRDPNDWPILAVAMLMGCPIWTEDRDFFGKGIATWTTDMVEIYLRPSSTSPNPAP